MGKTLKSKFDYDDDEMWQEVALSLLLWVTKFYFWHAVLTYESDTFPIEVKSMNRIKSFQMWTPEKLLGLT